MRIASHAPQDVFMCSSSSVCALAAPLKAADATHAQSAVTTTTRQKPTKRVRWGTVTALEFGVGHNACCVPSSAGPPVGLVGRPLRYTVSSVLPESPSASCSAASPPTRSASANNSGKSSRREDFWLCPMERVRILHEEAALSLDAITEICSGVSAMLDARAFSKFDHVAHHILETLELSRREDLSKLRATYHQDNRKKIVLF